MNDHLEEEKKPQTASDVIFNDSDEEDDDMDFNFGQPHNEYPN